MEDIERMAAMIHRHRDEDHDKIRSMMATLRVPDAVEVLNAVPSLEEAAEVLTLLPLDRSIDVCDQPTLQRRAHCSSSCRRNMPRRYWTQWRRTNEPPRCAKCVITAGDYCCH